jgi:hypothetical protein
VAIHKEDDLPVVGVAWTQLLPVPAAHLPVPPAADPASGAAAAAMADWPILHEALAAQRQTSAAQLGGAADQTDSVLDAADQANAAAITSTTT